MRQRYYRSTHSTPPFWVWFVVVGLLLTVFAIYKPVFEERVHRIAAEGEWMALNTDRLQRFADGQSFDDRLRVISIGTSLTRFATYPWPASNQTGAEFSRSEPIELLNITRAGSRIEDFTLLLDQIVEAHPDVLLIHDSLLLKNSNRRHEVQKIAQHLMKGWLSDRFGVNSIEPEWHCQEIRVCGENPKVVDEQKAARIGAMYAERLVVPPVFIELFTRAREKGIRVVVLHVSRQVLLRKHFSSALSDWYGKLRTAFIDFDNIPIWISPGGWEQEDYCDFSHLNDSGREKFMGWLESRLQGFPDETSQP